MTVSAYLAGDVLIDTGFAYVREGVMRALDRHRVSAVCCTHSHEDHTGNAGPISRMHACPVYLRHAERLWDEGVAQLAPYRRIWWGRVAPFHPEEMLEVLETGRRRFRAVPAPGHSATQVALFEESLGDVFVGDLFVSPGATAILTWADPWQEARSLRRVAGLRPKRMLTGHGLIVNDPATLLELKAERIEAAARRSVALASEGASPRTIVREVFPQGRLTDRFLELLTSRQFSRLNFVRAAVRLAPDPGASAALPQ